jgi:hypothetical protein
MNRRAFLSSLFIAPIAAAIMPRQTAWQRALQQATDALEPLPVAALRVKEQLERMNSNISGWLDEMHEHKTRSLADAVAKAKASRRSPLSYRLSTRR